MKHFFSFSFSFVVLSHQVLCTECLNEAKAPGDIIIGGLFPIHDGVEAGSGQEKWTCNRFNAVRLVQSLMMVYAIEEINRSGELGNITLGYLIRDSCSDVTTALNNTLSFMRENRISRDGALQSSPSVLAVIGECYSEITVSVTRLLNLESIPEISYSSTSGLLSDKTRFPSFLRTVPEDDHQARAIIEILKDHKWDWVGVLATDGEYGRYAVERLRYYAAEHNICFAYVYILPEFLVNTNYDCNINDTPHERHF
uniref:G-protein coupled receptor family C group 6 member A n=1 Tax=Austrofundulus limnaeus TaxID=52670 RepID=A0A2I4BHX1_AUSLI